MKRIRIAILAAALAGAAVYADTNNLPLDLPRTPVSFIAGYYLPSFTSSPYEFFNSFGFAGYIQNIFVTGPNLNVNYSFLHIIQYNTVLANSALNADNPVYAWQSQDTLDVSAGYSFMYFCRINADVNYSKNSLVYQDIDDNFYDYSRLNPNLNFVYDRRYSSLQQWTLGEVLIYPEEGYLLSLGDSYNIINDTGGNFQDNLNSITARGEFLLHPFKELVIAMDASGQSLLGHNQYQAFSPETNVIGSYNIPGDYFANGSVEMRFLFPVGSYWDSPAFWYIGSYDLKFSPGFILGYNGACAGYLNSGEQVSFIDSVYISPMLAIRLNGTLVSVLRFDIAAASGRNFNYVLSFNIGVIGSVPINVWRQGY
jgi:hypothetical protein